MPSPRNAWFRGRAGRGPWGPCEPRLAEEEEEEASRDFGSASVPPYRPLEEDVGLDGATVVLGGEAVGHASREGFQQDGRAVHQGREGFGEIHAALEAGAADVVLDVGVLGELIDVHASSP